MRTSGRHVEEQQQAEMAPNLILWTWKPCSLCQRPSLGRPDAFVATDS